MRRITIFTNDEIHKLASGGIVVAKAPDGVDTVYMSEQRWRSFEDADYSEIDASETNTDTPNITYRDIFEECLKRYPKLIGVVKDWRPVLEHYQAIFIWTENRKYYYSYGAKVLQPAGV